MIKGILFGLLFGIFTSFSQANSDKKTINSPPFKQGEWFQLRIHYGIFNASYATLSLERDTLKGRPVFHAKAYGETTGIANWFFKVEDYYESYFDEITNLPYKFIRDINEGGYTKKIEIDFDQGLYTAEVNNEMNESFTEKNKNMQQTELLELQRNIFVHISVLKTQWRIQMKARLPLEGQILTSK